MEGMKGVRVGVGEDHDMADGMQCTDHPYRNNPGGICAFCLQEKLGKLVSSSFPLPIPPSNSSSSSSPSLVPPSSTTRPCAASSITATPTTSATAPSSSSLPLSVSAKNINANHAHDYYTRRTRIPFLLAKKKKSKKPSSSGDIVLKRSKSTATPRRAHSLVDPDDDMVIDDDFSPRKRNGFWSFLYLSSSKSSKSKSFRDSNGTPRVSTINSAATVASGSAKLKEKCCSGSSLGRKSDIVVEDDNSPNNNSHNNSASFERKVSRSRSVGCGSRSFSGDFFERISTGFGDCTLRRVESQREGKNRVSSSAATAINPGGGGGPHHCMKERVRCGGLFSGFIMTSSSSSSSSSNSYWVSSSADDTVNGKSASVALSHSRGRSWGRAFASPMRAFSSKPSSKDHRRDIIRDANDKNATPNLSAIPSLLAVRG
ncbi:hypothetical protein RJT34_32259 [Clitoria ternatea]|uniref:Uncharacterized protein n=1 Tax=Clitoria ternatea TaxID=43366 RepID=A0AAN9EXU1_CLITE